MLLFTSKDLHAQTISAKELLKLWKDSSKQQTIIAAKIYDDLQINFNDASFHENCRQLQEHLKEKTDARLEVRATLYEYYGTQIIHGGIDKTLYKRLKNTITLALQLKDEQLLSEVYAAYYEQRYGDMKEKLFYITQVVEKQEKIGTQYFPRIYYRYYNLSLSYYLSNDYAISIKNAEKGLATIKNPQKQLDIYCFLLDLAGASYYELGDPEQGKKYYLKLQDVLKHYQRYYATYKYRFKTYDPTFVSIWQNIANGGIARASIAKKNYEEALTLLHANLESSRKHELYNDVAKVQNLMGDIYTQQGDIHAANAFYTQALYNSKQSEDQRNTLTALKGISDTYKALGKFDSAYYYVDAYYLAKEKMAKDINERNYSTIEERLEQEHLKLNIEQTELKLKEQQQSRNLSVFIFIIILLVLIIIYIRVNFKQKLKYNLSEVRRKNALRQLEMSKRDIEESKKQLDLFKTKLTQNNKIIETLQKQNAPTNEDYTILKNATILTHEDWENFKKQFEKVYPNFINDLKSYSSNLSQAELRYLCLLKLNLSTQEIASAIGVSPASLRVTKYRIRKKVEENPNNGSTNILELIE